jgi:hypothetical protein
VFWFRGWMSEKPGPNHNRPAPWNGDNVGLDSPAVQGGWSNRAIKLPWFWAVCRAVGPSMVASFVVSVGYLAGTSFQCRFCRWANGLGTLAGFLLLLVATCRFVVSASLASKLFSTLAMSVLKQQRRSWVSILSSGRLQWAGSSGPILLLYALCYPRHFLPYEHGDHRLIAEVLLLVPLLVGSMVLQRQRQWISAVGAWSLLFAGVVSLVYNKSHWRGCAMFFPDWTW